ncbi:hypothetical protein BDC45DRAFT_305974 [Circinella umbellata]|nr:hypothetical protein BDC45DRAFT_305974 [Circinella umbellata]
MILDIVSSYRWGNIYRTAVAGGERDFIMLIWRAIDMCFQNLYVDALKGNPSSGADPRLQPLLEMNCGFCFTTALRSDQQSFAGSARYNENHVGDDGRIKPKVQGYKPDMALRLAADLDNEEKNIRKLQVVGIINTHLRMDSMVLDMPAGYICRIMPLVEQKIGATLGEQLYKTYIPFLEQVIILKMIVKNTINVVTAAVDDDEDSDIEQNRIGWTAR